jgi:hypothetical protein
MSESLLNELNKFKDTYYIENKKKIFQKKSQKYEVAKEITSRFDINVLLQKTAYIIPNTNKVFVNYLMFKQFAQPDNYELFVKYVQNLVYIVIDKKKSFECHINIESFTISAAERYKGVIKTFSEGVFGYTENMDAIYVYNSPLMIEKISKVFLQFIDQSIKNKITLVNKTDGEEIVTSFKKYSFRSEL